MKTLLIIAFFHVFALNALSQSVESTPRLSVSLQMGVGNGKVKSSLTKQVHGLYNGGNLLLNYHFDDHLSITTGVGILTYNANLNVNGRLAVTELDFLQIPVKLNYSWGSDAIQMRLGVVGFYNSHILSVTNLNNGQITKDSDLGGNFGFSGEFGPMLRINDRLSTSVSLEHQFTVTKDKGTQVYIENYLVRFGVQYAITTRK